MTAIHFILFGLIDYFFRPIRYSCFVSVHKLINLTSLVNSSLQSNLNVSKFARKIHRICLKGSFQGAIIIGVLGTHGLVQYKD